MDDVRSAGAAFSDQGNGLADHQRSYLEPPRRLGPKVLDDRTVREVLPLLRKVAESTNLNALRRHFASSGSWDLRDDDSDIEFCRLNSCEVLHECRHTIARLGRVCGRKDQKTGAAASRAVLLFRHAVSVASASVLPAQPRDVPNLHW